MAREAERIEVMSRAFSTDQEVPKKYTADGDDVSPPLAWAGVPKAAKELVIVVVDPDAPKPQPFVHWMMYKIPASVSEIPEGLGKGERIHDPAGALQGRNSMGAVGYNGPSPPKGHGVHHYHFRVYAVDVVLDVKPGADRDALLKAIEGHVVGEGEVVGRYERR
jgi:Raf kinase inhibitor-like YbhB/YbcL family protein